MSNKLQLFTSLTLLVIGYDVISALRIKCQCPTTPLRNGTGGQFFGSSISCCDGGHPQCKHRGSTFNSNIGSLDDTLFCYHDASCVIRGRYGRNRQGCNYTGVTYCYAGDLHSYRVHNTLGAVSKYRCQHVRDFIATNTSSCLSKGCTSFSANVLMCECGVMNGSNHCTCRTSNDAYSYRRHLQVYRAIFFTFDDVFTDGSRNKRNMSSIIFLSCFGGAMLMLFLVLLYRVIRFDRLRSSQQRSLPENDQSAESEKPPSFDSVIQRDNSIDGLPSYNEAIRDSRPINTAPVERY